MARPEYMQTWDAMRNALPPSIIEIYDASITRAYDNYDDQGARKLIQAALTAAAALPKDTAKIGDTVDVRGKPYTVIAIDGRHLIVEPAK